MELQIVSDYVNSARMTLNSSGTVLGTTDFRPFGEPIVAGLASRKSYIDREVDRENSLGNFGVRAYDAGLGRFLSVDPLWEKYRGLGGYQYAGNDPVRQLDPSGKTIDFAGDKNLKNDFVAAMVQAERYDPNSGALMRYLYENTTFTIRLMRESKADLDNFDPSSNSLAGMPTIHWAPTGGLEYSVVVGGKSVTQRLSPTACLVDECNSAFRFVTNPKQFDVDYDKKDDQYETVGERYSIQCAFGYASKACEVDYVRQNHNDGTAFETKGVTSNEPNSIEPVEKRVDH